MWWVVGILIVLVLAALWVRRTARGSVDPTELTFAPETMAQVRQLAGTDKISAIKTLREAAPGLGLAQAKLMVDRMAAPPAAAVPATPDIHADLDLDTEMQAHQLKQDDQAIAAIKLVRETTGWSLAQAKAYVDRL